MNWYKVAKKEKKVLNPEDLFLLYAFMSSPQNLDNLEVLIDVAEKMNYIRDVYIDILLDEIALELSHAIFKNYALDVDYLLTDEGRKFVKPYPSCSEWLSKYRPKNKRRGEGEDENAKWNKEIKEEDNECQEYMDYMRSSIRLNDSIQYDIEKLVSRLTNRTFSKADLDKAIYYFKILPWKDNYGGTAWGEITKWAKRLIDIPPVNINLLYSHPNQAIRHMRELGYVLDVINSIEHNTGRVLSYKTKDTAGMDANWLTWALDLIKHSDPLTLAYFSGNRDMMAEVKRHLMCCPQYRPSAIHVVKTLADTIREMPLSSACKILRELNDVNLLMNIAIRICHDDEKLWCLLRNRRIYTKLDGKTFVDFMKKLKLLIGKEKLHKILRKIVATMSDFFNMTYYDHVVVDFMRSFDDPYIDKMFNWQASINKS